MNLSRLKVSIVWHYENWMVPYIYRWIINPFYRWSVPNKVKRVRKKGKIDVMFIVTEIGPWKTEQLFQAMALHNRFHPFIGISASKENPSSKSEVIKYITDKGYEFTDLDTFPKKSADIIFYQKPYIACYSPHILYRKHLDSLFCYVNYGFHAIKTRWSVNQELYKFVWQYYFECDMGFGMPAIYNVITGVPMQDKLMQRKEKYINPWKPSGKKKRIIYAPHHTVGIYHLKDLATSSFLENADTMVELMHKYADNVQWAFKPHPLLYDKLVNIWGQERTDAYYDEWKNSDNSQLENGAYDALFAHSDAMIHDCVSFVIEYHYTHNPVLYLTRTEGDNISRTSLSQESYDLHYKGYTREHIEQFIENVVNGVDPLKKKREEFYRKSLLPPHGKTACENIINSILEIEEYKNQK